MEIDAPLMRNTHFIPRNENAQCALQYTHQNSTIGRMTAGDKIRQIRTAKQMTLAEVEGRAGITDGNLSRIERGKQWVSEEVLRSIAQALNVRVADFFSDDPYLSKEQEYEHPAILHLETLLERAGDEARLLTVYRLASADDRKEIDAAIADVIGRLDIISILNKR